MAAFFQKKLILLDVDHTLINWTNLSTLWAFRGEWQHKVTQSQRAVSLRGHRTPIDGSISSQAHHQIHLNQWSTKLIEYLQSTGHWLAIFSDFHQPLLKDWFEEANLHHIAIGMDSGCLKPLPDGCYQLMAQLGVPGSQTFLIGDGLRTDSRAIHAVGGHFIPIEAIRHNTLSTLSTWIL